MCIGVLPACLSMDHLSECLVLGLLDSLKLELWTVVSHCVGAENQTGSFARSVSALSC